MTQSCESGPGAKTKDRSGFFVNSLSLYEHEGQKMEGLSVCLGLGFSLGFKKNTSKPNST